MPKLVDHAQRRREIVEALFRVVSRDGLAAATIRAVAAEADIPAPRVQYYFATKSDLLDAAFAELGRTLVGRGLALQQAAGPDAPPETLLRAALAGSKPVDDESRRAAVLFLTFLTAAVNDPDIADTQLVRSQRLITNYFADLIRQAQHNGDADPLISADHEAPLILFANTGLSLAALSGILTLDEATAALDHHLERVFTRARPRAAGGEQLRG